MTCTAMPIRTRRVRAAMKLAMLSGDELADRMGLKLISPSQTPSSPQSSEAWASSSVSRRAAWSVSPGCRSSRKIPKCMVPGQCPSRPPLSKRDVLYPAGERRAMPSSSVVIVGGGLMGLSAAWHLRRADSTVGVVVLERFQVGAAASGASAAGVRAMGRDRAERALALASLARWPDLARELEHETGYRRGGGLRVALDESAWRAAPGWVAEQRADGVPVEVVDTAATHGLAPGLSRDVLGGVHCAIDGQAEAMTTVTAFAAAAGRLGAHIEEGVEAARLVVQGGRV